MVQKHFKNLKLRITDLILLKLVHYVYYLNNLHLVKTEGVNQREGAFEKPSKVPGIYQNLDFNMT